MWNRQTHVISRVELYELVWSEPVESVARRYKLSGPGFAKMCKRNRIPLPARGYWAKVQHGQQPRRISLRPAKTPEDEMIRITERMRPRPSSPPKPALESLIAAAVDRALKPENLIVMPEPTRRPHRLVRAAAQMLDRPSWDGKRKLPDLIELRRRRLLSAFFHGVEHAKGSVEEFNMSGSFHVVLYGSTIKLSCSEPERRVKMQLDAIELRNRQSWETRDWKTESQPSGVLRIRVYSERDRFKDFVDVVNVQLEEKLTDVLVYLLRQTITIAERDRRAEADRRERAEAARRQREEEIQRWERQTRRRQEQENITILIEQATKWR